MKRKFLALILAIVSVFTLFAISNKDAKEVEAVKPTTVYLKPNSNWKQSNAWFSIYVWGTNKSAKFVEMTEVEAGVYKADLPSGYNENIIFCRMDSGKSTLDWNSVWNQTSDLTIQDGKNCYTVSSGAWSKGSGSWGSYTEPVGYKAYDVAIRGSFDMNGSDWGPGLKLTDPTEKHVYEGQLALSGEVPFKVVVGTDGWLGHSNITVEGITVKNDKDDNCVATFEEGVYKFSYDYNAKKLTVSTISLYADVVNGLKALVEKYNKDSYVRETHIYADLNKIQADFENSNLVHSLGDLFHNVGVENKNVILDRTTTFVGDYLYFNNGVAFGSNGDKLTSFTWTEEYVPTTHGDAVDNHFITLKDFAELNATDKNGTVSLVNGWSVSGGVYTSTDDAVIKAAVAFTAPGWTMIDSNYIDFVQVVIYEAEDGLHIELWASSGNSGLLVDGVRTNGNNCLFSEAIVK